MRFPSMYPEPRSFTPEIEPAATIRFREKMNSGGIMFPVALIQHKAVTFFPRSPLTADLICLTPLVPGSTTLLKPVSSQFQMFVTSKLPPVKICWNFWKKPSTAARLNPLMGAKLVAIGNLADRERWVPGHEGPQPVLSTHLSVPVKGMLHVLSLCQFISQTSNICSRQRIHLWFHDLYVSY